MKLAIITICTNRKRIEANPNLYAHKLLKEDTQSVITSWTKKINTEKNKIPARELYCGRGFSEILKTIRTHDSELWIISAGLGLIQGNLKIPSYNLTIKPTSVDAIQKRIMPSSEFHPAKWWKALNKKIHGSQNPIRDLINSNPDTFFIVSLSSTYLSLISDDLLQLTNKETQRVRIVGLNSSKTLPDSLKHLLIPYDDRFDGPLSPNPGTRADFSQRVTRHFIEEVYLKTPFASVYEHAQTITNMLFTMPHPKKFNRTTMDDEGIKNIIKKRWKDANGSSSKMLRLLRDEENIACEQSRFAGLFKNVKLRFL